MEQGIIDNVVSKQALKQVDDLTAKLNLALAAMEKIATASTGGTGGGGKAKQMDELAKAQQKVLALETQLSTAQAKLDTALGQNVRMIAQKRDQLTTLNREQRLEAQLANAAADSYAKLSAEYRLALFQLQNYTKAQKDNIGGHDAMVKNVARLNQELKNHDRQVGTFSRNVGNYTNQTFQMTQVMRELPNFAIDARIGFMALSNNLPMLADGFQQLAKTQVEVTDKMGNVTTKAMGTAGAWKVMLKSLFSLNTVMIVAVTLMTLFGDKIVDWVGKVFKGSKAVDEFVSSAKQMAETMRKGKEDAQAEITTLNALYEASQDNKRSMDERKMAVDELQKKYPKYFGNLTDEEILLGKGKDAYNDLTEAMYRNAITRASLDKITENSKEMLKLDEAITWRKREILRMETEIANIRGGREDRFLNQQESDRIDAFNISLVTLRGEMGRMERGYEAFNKSNQRLKGNLNIEDLIDRSSKGLGKLDKAIKDNTQALRPEIESLRLLLDVIKEMAGISDEDPIGAFEDRLESMGKTLQSLMSADQAAEYQKWLDGLTEAEEKQTITKEERKQKIIQGSLDTIMKLYDNHYNALQDQIQSEEESKLNSLNRQRDEELAIQGLTAEEKQNINDEYDRREYAVKQQAFEREKKLKKEAVLMDAAMGAVRIWSENDPITAGVLSLFLAGLTLDSINKINAAQYPAFAEGGIMDHDGLAWVSDGKDSSGRYKQEIGITKSGSMFITPKKPTLMHLDKGTEILPDASILNNQDINRAIMISTGGNTVDFSDLRKDIHVLTSEVKKLKAEPAKGSDLMSKMKFAKDYN